MNWDNKPKSAGAFAGFLLGVYFLEPWMITLGLLIPFIKNIIVRIHKKLKLYCYFSWWLVTIERFRKRAFHFTCAKDES